MRCCVFQSLLYGLAVLCAGTLAREDPELAGLGNLSLQQVTVSTDTWYRLLRRNVGQMLEKRSGIRTEEEMKNLDMVKWSTDTVKLCAAKFNHTTSVANDAGIAGCWNLIYYITNTGAFAADLRLFQIVQPTGDWKDVDKATLKGQVAFPPDHSALRAKNMTESDLAASKEGMKDTTLVKIEDYQFTGTVTHAILLNSHSDTELKAILTPEVFILGNTKGGKPLNATVSLKDAEFVNGVFSTTPSLSDEDEQEVQNQPFQLPGMSIEIVPVGLYFFGAYMVVGTAIFGWGTIERKKFRGQYRKRLGTQDLH